MTGGECEPGGIAIQIVSTVSGHRFLNVSRNLFSAAAENAGIISAGSTNCKPNIHAAFAQIDQAASLLHHRRRFTRTLLSELAQEASA